MVNFLERETRCTEIQKSESRIRFFGNRGATLGPIFRVGGSAPLSLGEGNLWQPCEAQVIAGTSGASNTRDAAPPRRAGVGAVETQHSPGQRGSDATERFRSGPFGPLECVSVRVAVPE